MGVRCWSWVLSTQRPTAPAYPPGCLLDASQPGGLCVVAESILEGWAYKLFLQMASVQRRRPESLPLRSRKGGLRGTLPGATCLSRVSCREQMGGVDSCQRARGLWQAVVSAEPGKWPGHNTASSCWGWWSRRVSRREVRRVRGREYAAG